MYGGLEMNSLVNPDFRGIQVRVNVDLTTLSILPCNCCSLYLIGWNQFLLNASERLFVFVSHLCILEDGLGTG